VRRSDLPPSAPAPWVVLVVGVLCTAGATGYVSKTIGERDALRLQSSAHDIRAALEARMDAYVALLRAGTGLFAASDEVTRDEFQRFAQQIRLRERFPGLLGIGFSRWLTPEQVRPVQQEMRAAGQPRFTIWPPEPRRDVYTAIVYLEPLDEMNQRAIGFDMFNEATRREAMQRALETGEPAVAGRVVLVQEGTDDPGAPAGILVYAAVYRGGGVPEPEEREVRLLGFVYSPIRAGDLLQTVLSPDDRRELVVRVYDGETMDEKTLLYDSAGAESSPIVVPDLLTQVVMEVAGRTWTVSVQARPVFRETAASLVPSIFITGLAVSLLLFLLTRAEARARLGAELTAEALRRSKEELDAANRAKDEFLATLSHELRTPLNAILGWTRMLRMGHLDEARQADALEVVERNARVQVRLIEDLLDVSRIITGKLRLELRPMPLAPALDEAAATVRPAADAKGVALTCTWDDDLGEVVAAPERLQQILWNLLSNAIKFTPRGGSVTLRAEPVDGTVQIVVIDTGAGIRRDFLPHVFERFRQADSSTTRAHSGVGLGLAIVRHLVELHGGTIDAASDGPDRGATFTVTLRRRVLAPGAADGSALPAGLSDADDLGGLSVLVVDDEEDARGVASAVLSAHGARVLTAASVQEALALVDRELVHVVVADIGMPGEDGYQLLERLRGRAGPRSPALPVIALTAYARAEDRSKALAHGFQAYLSKPVEPAEFAAVVASLAGGAGQG
jgi:signal transduction histidine kinase/ActR/RegA family two-component response regulator